MVWFKRALMLIVLAAIVGAIIYALMPKPVPVDVATIGRGTIEVTVDEEGVASVRDVYRLSTPIGGSLARLALEVGDTVKRDVTVVAEIRPAEPAFLDSRARRELEAAAGAATAAVSLAEAEVSRARAEARLAEADLARAARLSRTGTISERALEEAGIQKDVALARVRQAEANLELRQRELDSARARLIQPDSREHDGNGSCCVLVRSPVDGVVLALHAESEQVVTAGALIAEIGDPEDIEIVVDLLSTDAVQVSRGAVARIEGWGGEGSLTARVRRIEPSAFTKVSALGIEEQRVNVVLDLVEPPTDWRRLGHAFRVYARIRLWQGEDVVRVPLAALFRRGAQWSVFRVADGVAVLTPVTIDHRDTQHAQVVDGLAPGDTVVLYPGDRVEDGVAVQTRENAGGST